VRPESSMSGGLDAIHKVVVRFRHQISGLITDVVKSWDAEEVSRAVELGDRQGSAIHTDQWHAGRRHGSALLLHAGMYLAGT